MELRGVRFSPTVQLILKAMKVKLLRKVGNQEAGTVVDVNDKMYAHLTSNGWAEKGDEDMSKFKLNENFNGSFAGETVNVPDYLDKEVISKKIGVKVKAEKPPRNKAIQSTPRNKKK